MKQKDTALIDGSGRLPSIAPLANPYVPFQNDHPIQYEAPKAIIRGTLYPGLDLPFKGMVNNKPLPATPLANLQTLDFAIQELALYLDTHSDDQEAYELYCKYQQVNAARKKDYVHVHGAISHMTASDAKEYDWLKDPWPWEYCGSKEG